ncbi:Uncharacterised protein [Serratia quinivorans]|uniref:Uncharacterized protein n=1 Tax=Serratia quinivorans TaxID=137545 RepID=A0A380AV42_9GAMM|nr:Uncharacterised protein [Serratia quinivorans]
MKSKIIPLLCQEEGTELMPYHDSLGYPTVGTGFKIGPAGVPLDNYTFSLTQPVNDVWLQSLVDETMAKNASRRRNHGGVAALQSATL